MKTAFVTALLAVSLAAAPAAAAKSAPGVLVGPGKLKPVYLPDANTTQVPVDAFRLDRVAVTNAEFLKFVKQHPGWQKDRAKKLFTDDKYLARWEGPLSLGKLAPSNAPVVQVSWFAARAYCKAKGGRLPTENEWELAAQAGVDEDPQLRQKILSWYGQPAPKVFGPVGQGDPNKYGVQDLHGLIWEWVDDFSNTLVTGDSRQKGDPDKVKFCGAGAVGAADKLDYAAFMRVAFRSSLQGRYSVGNLGFRCAYDLPGSNS